MTLQEVERNLAAHFDLDEAALEDFMRDLWAEYLGELNAELTEYFRALRPQYKTGIISNSFVGATEREKAKYGFHTLCDVLIYSHEVGLEKPDPRIFDLALERLAVEPQETIFLDDIAMHVDSARKLGIHAVLFHDNAQAIAEIEALLAR